jgi:glycosyltransferase involved in cell wall biosynthesis
VVGGGGPSCSCLCGYVCLLMMNSVSVIIPSGNASRDPNLERLLADLRSQSVAPAEIEIVRGVSPNGLARNVGVERTAGDVLVFLDDDVRLGTPDVLRSFVQHLTTDASLGTVGTSQLLPPSSTAFQRRCARQVSRSESPIVEQLTESDMVTTQCCAMRREVLVEVGRFHSQIIRGVDPELRHRVRGAGYRIAVVPNCWHYHPMPASLGALLAMAWRNGAASAYARRHFPEAVLDNPGGHVARFAPRLPFRQRILRSAGRLASDTVTGRWYGTLYALAYLGGTLRAAR